MGCPTHVVTPSKLKYHFKYELNEAQFSICRSAYAYMGIKSHFPATTSPQGVTNLRIKTVSKQQIAPSTVSSTAPTVSTTTAAATKLSVTKPTEHTSIGGISVGNKNAG